MRIDTGHVDTISFPGQVDPATVVKYRPAVVQVTSAACLGEKAALEIAMHSNEWPMVKGWAFCGDLFENMLNKALDGVVSDTLKNTADIDDVHLFEYFLQTVAGALRQKKQQAQS